MSLVREDYFWPGSAEGRFGISFTVYPDLLHLLYDNQQAAVWEEEFRARITAIATEVLLESQVDAAVDCRVEQIGSNLEDAHSILLWLDNLPRDLVTSLITLSVEHGFGALIGRIKKRVKDEQLQIGGVDLEAVVAFHSRTLVELCKDHASLTYDVAPDSFSSATRTLDATWLTQFQIELQAGEDEYHYRVRADGLILDHFTNRQPRSATHLLPNNNSDDESIMPILPRFVEYPSQDGTDRCEHIAIFAGACAHPTDEDTFTKPFLQAAVCEAVAEVAPELDLDHIQSENYQIGPAAGGIFDFVATLFESRHEMASTLGLLVDAWAVYEITTRVARKLQSKRATRKNRDEPIRVWFTPGTVAMLCEEWIRRSYHPRANLIVDWRCLSQEFHGGYTSPAHPNAQIEYLVAVSTSKETYFFRIMGTGEVVSLTLRRGRLEATLAKPDILVPPSGKSSSADRSASIE